MLKPKYVTVEEVPEFLSKIVSRDRLIGKGAGCETVSLQQTHQCKLDSGSGYLSEATLAVGYG